MTQFSSMTSLTETTMPSHCPQTYRETLIRLLSQDLDFHRDKTHAASHEMHSFPAKFPPQLPRLFITELTSVGEVVLDPMAGSGTTILEAFLTERRGIGFDIDPLARLMAQVKVGQFDLLQLLEASRIIISQAEDLVEKHHPDLVQTLENDWQPKTQKFIHYWFARETQIELLALITAIQKIPEEPSRKFFELAFSGIIITKTGGTSLAFDLAHTRPHKAKVVISRNGEILATSPQHDSARGKLLTKVLRSPIREFEKKVHQNLKSIFTESSGRFTPFIDYGDAQQLPLGNASVDIIITSPPYASNAIDYMRAHKFSLVWMGYSLDELSQKRRSCIGGEATTALEFERFPQYTTQIIQTISQHDQKRGRVLARYYSEMKRTLQEMFRVLKPGKAAIVVVGTSIMKGHNSSTHECLADIGRSLGFEVPKIGIRKIDRNRRMLPAGFNIDLNSQIQQRMHEEYVIGFYKPCL